VLFSKTLLLESATAARELESKLAQQAMHAEYEAHLSEQALRYIMK
jgi:hypothetical protein